MADQRQAMDNLTYVKEVIETMPDERKKEFFDYFVKYSNSKAANQNARPTTPEPSTSHDDVFQSAKRRLQSPISPKRSKKDKQVYSLYYFLRLIISSKDKRNKYRKGKKLLAKPLF